MKGGSTSEQPLDRTSKGLTYGLLIPHFGEHASPERIIDLAVTAEDVGFDAVWVRDHLLWQPHGGIEGDDVTFVESLTCLAAIGARTKRIILGTAVLIPIRWPLKLAQDLSALTYLFGPRVVAGLGLGSGEAELAAAGFNRKDRKKIFVETAEILRLVWNQNGASYQGKMFSFEDVTIEPKPISALPLWYGGTSRISVENAVRYCDGWMPGRIPLLTLDDRLEYLRALESQDNKKISTAVIPLVKIDPDGRKARTGIDFDGLVGSSEASANWVQPKNGFKTLDDLRGLLVVGDPDEACAQIAEVAERGIDHFVFDLRLQFDEVEKALQLIGDDVLPALRSSGI